MNAITPTLKAYQQTTLARLAALIGAAEEYSRRYAKAPHKTSTDYAWLELCEAASLVFDDSPREIAESLRAELNIDEDGNQLDVHGEPLRTFNPSRVHPDNPCQSKGWA